MVHLPIMVVASIVGVWLFTLQHRFETAQWTNETQWRFTDAALTGSSWLRLPRVLNWLTGNIGFHHIHHLNPRVPNYRLGAAHTAVQELRRVRGLGLMDGLRAPRLTLWDEVSGRLVRFSDAARPAAGRAIP
jgi:omega-6 fatty acid desaturase (delta-12 desaturase)